VKDAPDHIVVFDTETGGTDVCNDRIVQAFIGLMDRDGQWIKKREIFINPEVPVSPEASEVHGLTNEFLAENGVPPEVGIEQIVSTLYLWMQPRKRRGQTKPIVAYNAAFDLSILTAEARRYDIPETLATVPYVIDPYVCDKAKDKYRPGKRKQSFVAEHYGIPVDESRLHDAAYDCELAGRLGWVMIDAWQGTLESLHDRQVGWREEQNQSLEDYFDREGIRNEDGSKIIIDRGWPVYDKVRVLS